MCSEDGDLVGEHRSTHYQLFSQPVRYFSLLLSHQLIPLIVGLPYCQILPLFSYSSSSLLPPLSFTCQVGFVTPRKIGERGKKGGLGWGGGGGETF